MRELRKDPLGEWLDMEVEKRGAERVLLRWLEGC
jgi:hypothetical protein